MSLSLVIHHPPGNDPLADIALQDGIWEVAESHWRLDARSVLVGSDLTAAYLLEHFRRALARRGFPDPGLLLVMPVGARFAAIGLPADAAAWLAGMPGG